MRKKVIFAINNLGMGGAQNMLIEQVRYMNRERFEPLIVTLLRNPEINVVSNIPANVKFVEFNFSRIFTIKALFALWLFLRRERVDAIITNLFETNLLGRVAAVLAGVPIVLSYEHNVYKDKRRWQIIADRILARFTKKILVSSNEVLEFTSKQEGLPKSKFQLNLNSIPLKLGDAKKNREAVLKKYGLEEEFVYIVAIGSLTEQKGHRYLIDAVYEIKNRDLSGFKVLIFGRGSLKNELLAQINNLGLENVSLMGVAPIEDIVAITDIFTLPSLWEGLSIALLQAMDARCPIVVTRVSGTSDALENEVSALIIDPGESHQLSKALERLLKDQDLRRKLSEKAKEKVNEFSIEKNVKVIEDLIASE